MSTKLSDVAKAICDRHGYTYISYEGCGTFKETFCVSDVDGEKFALKIYKSDARDEREMREIDAMQRCVHPNVAKFHSLAQFTYSGAEHMYIIEEFIGGGTLTDKLKTGQMSLAAVGHLGSQLIDAIGHIASHNLIHRDIKPDNILFREDMQTPVIVDFGLVRDLGATSQHLFDYLVYIFVAWILLLEIFPTINEYLLEYILLDSLCSSHSPSISNFLRSAQKRKFLCIQDNDNACQ